MGFREYVRAWRRRAFAGVVGWAQFGAFAASCGLSIWGLFKPLGDLMTWVPALAALVVFLGCVLIGVIRAPFLLHREIVLDRDRLTRELGDREKIKEILINLGKLRRIGVSLRNDLAEKAILSEEDKNELSKWSEEVKSEIGNISPVQAELFNALDIVTMVVPDSIARHRELVWHSGRLKRLMDFISNYDSMLAMRGIGTSQAS